MRFKSIFYTKVNQTTEKPIKTTKIFSINNNSSYPTSRETKMAAESFLIAKKSCLSILPVFLGHKYNT